MDLQKLKSEHPDLVDAIAKEAKAEERERTAAWLKYMNVDAKAVAKGIEEGNEITPSQREELIIKMSQAKQLENLEEEGKDAKAQTEEPEGKEKTGVEKAKADVNSLIEQHYKSEDK